MDFGSVAEPETLGDWASICLPGQPAGVVFFPFSSHPYPLCVVVPESRRVPELLSEPVPTGPLAYPLVSYQSPRGTAEAGSVPGA